MLKIGYNAYPSINNQYISKYSISLIQLDETDENSFYNYISYLYYPV
jgi:hypothetical protein